MSWARYRSRDWHRFWRRSRSASGTTRPVRLFGQTFAAAVIDRSAMGADGTIAGPAIINQMDTTTLVPPGWQARRVAAGALVLERTAPEGKSTQ